MGVLKDLGDMLLKIGEIIVARTEEYTQTVRQMLELKKLENDMDKTKILMANHILARMKKGEKSVSFKDKEMKNFSSEIARLGDEASKIRKIMDKPKPLRQKKNEN